jgi:hypothetical protein
MQVKFLLPAQYELDEAIDYYNMQAPQLDGFVLVLAIAHLHRKPAYWKKIISRISTL